MNTPDELVTTPAGTPWRDVPAEQRAAMLDRARVEYGDDERWDALPEVAKAWAAIHVEAVLPDDDPRLRRPGSACPKHAETPFIVGADNTAWPCDSCEAGTKVDAAVWFSRIFSRRGRKFMRSDSEYAKFLSYLRQRPNGVALRDAVNRLLDAEEAKPVQGDLP